jgi:hypothetical protein
LGCETGKAYASEIKMLNQILNKVDFIKGLPFTADKGLDFNKHNTKNLRHWTYSCYKDKGDI